jgi:hypothetical protein
MSAEEHLSEVQFPVSELRFAEAGDHSKGTFISDMMPGMQHRFANNPERKEMFDDIGKNGVREPLRLMAPPESTPSYPHTVLDGHHRAAAAIAHGLKSVPAVVEPQMRRGGPMARRAFVYKYLLEHGCTDCGYNKDARALSFDHLPGTVKVREIKSGQQFGWQALVEEIAKCDVVCWFCHIDRTMERNAEEVMN